MGQRNVPAVWEKRSVGKRPRLLGWQEGRSPDVRVHWRWLTKRLVDEGATVVGLVWDAEDADPDATFYSLGLDRRVTCTTGDVRDLRLLENVLSDNCVDTAFHLAAQAIVTKANVSPLETFETNRT
jgi:nucleoside-diphosphate-sugar epimerase